MEIQSTANSAAIEQFIGSASLSRVASQSNAAIKPPEAEVNEIEVTQAEAEQAVATVNLVVQVFNKDVEFSIDDATGINVVKVREKESDEVIRQLPLDAVIKFARTLESLQGLLIKQRV